MSRALHFTILASLTVLGGCDQRDPYLRTDVWNPTGANAGNIAAMVADPHDLISGRGTDVQNSNEPALAVGHVWLDQPKSLSPGGSGGGGGGAQSGGGGTGSGASGGGSGGASGSPGS
ncbi:MAG TPA: hypothetical protein VND19_26030 [Acetobacteraceae bacterium]|nr:hypothetical protein [Acetobacteraceae bacterium]